MDFLIDLLVSLTGVLIVGYILAAAIRTFVLPRGEDVWLTRWIFRAVYIPFRWCTRRTRTYDQRDRILTLFAPTALLVTPVIWVTLIILGYALIYWGMGVRPMEAAITLRGSSLLTLGTVPFIALPITLVEFSEAIIGLGLVALLISYLPTMYSMFSRREAQVTMLEVCAGAPPAALEMIKRLHRVRGLDPALLNQVWTDWEIWFTELEESHSSLWPLAFFRSQNPKRSWITAAGTVLDAAALVDSTVDIDRDPQSNLMLRAGYLALQSIATTFRIRYDPAPNPGDLISIMREEFDEAYDELKEEGIPVRTDREQAWRDFTGWRVNYDRVLLHLARLIDAPYARWVSDRSIPGDRAYQQQKGHTILPKGD